VVSVATVLARHSFERDADRVESVEERTVDFVEIVHVHELAHTVEDLME
jgi:hypothetical protein